MINALILLFRLVFGPGEPGPYLCCIHCRDVRPHFPDTHEYGCLGKGCELGNTRADAAVT